MCLGITLPTWQSTLRKGWVLDDTAEMLPQSPHCTALFQTSVMWESDVPLSKSLSVGHFVAYNPKPAKAT